MIVRARSSLNAVDDVPFLQQQLDPVRSVLAGHAGDERDFTLRVIREVVVVDRSFLVIVRLKVRLRGRRHGNEGGF